MKKRIFSFLLALVMVLGMVPTSLFGTRVSAAELEGNEISVTGNVIDITDKQIYKLSSKYQVTATDITVSGADVVAAAEDGTTVYVLLDGATAPDAAVSVEFGYSGNKCSLTDHTGTVTLENGEGTLNLTVKGYYNSSSSLNSTVNYTIHFTVDVPPTEVPTRLKETDSASTYNGVAVELDISDYFENGVTYYLIEGDTKTALEGKKYTFCTNEGGTHTLVFGAGNTVGDCPDYVTVTVEVTEIKSGIWIGQTSGNGSWDYVLFKDADGNGIEGLTAALGGKTIQVYLPKNYDPSGKVTAEFSLTQSGDLPVLTTKTATAGASGNRWDGNTFTKKTFTLSGGAASLTFYYCNQSPKSESPVTWNLNIQMLNDLPTLAEGISATEEATITAGQTYSVNLDSLFTDADGDALTYKVSINSEAAVAADADYTFSTTTAGTYTLVFTASDGKGTSAESYTVTLTVENASDTYAMTAALPESVEPAFYVCSGYDANGNDILGTALTVTAGETADGMTAYTLNYPTNADTISVRAEGWGGMAFAAQENTTVTLRQVQLSVVDYDNNPAESTNKVTYGEHTAVAGENGWLLAAGTEYTVTATPTNTDLKTTSQKVALESGTEIYTVQLLLDINNPVAITVPTGAKAQLYKYNKYYSNDEFDAKIIRDNEDGTTTFYFVADTKDDTLIYRVSMEGKITKSGWVAWGKNNMTFTCTDEDKAPSYRLDDYTGTGQANSTITEDSVLLNINSRNHLSLSVGDSKVLKAYRAWEIIPVSYNNYILTPDFHYTVLSGSDVVSLTAVDSASAADGDWMKLTALREGVAIIEVTYDAMEVEGGQYDGIYGASDPARTGFVVVQVGGSNDTSVNFGIQGFSSIGKSGSKNISYNPDNQKAWDAEFDTLYFTESSGKIDLKPTAGSTIQEVAVSNDKGATWTVLTGTDGTYTATIVPGNNIIRVTTGAGVAYQVVRGDKITVTVTEVTDNSDGDGEIEVGETVRVTLKGLHTPIPKMAGNYNPGYGGNTDGYSSHHLNYTANGEAVYGKGTQYTFINETNFIDVVVPESGIVELTDGYIGMGVQGLTTFADGGDSHRNIPDAGCGTRDSKTTFHTRSVLPEITVTAVDADLSIPVTEVKLDQTAAELEVGQTLSLTATVIPNDATDKTVTWSSSDEAVATVENGVVTAVSAGEATITAKAEDKEATCVVTVTETKPSASYTIKLSEAEELTAGLNYFISVPAEGQDLIIDFGTGTIKGAMCQRHCSKRDHWTAGEGSTFVITAENVAAHLCNETRRAEIAEDFDLYLTEGSQMLAVYWWTTANMNGSYLYIEILPAEGSCSHETWNAATCKTPKTCADCGATEGDADPDAHSYVDGTCEYCGEAQPSASYTIKLSEAEELTSGLNYFISVPAEAAGKDIIFDFGSGTISGMMCQRHCSKRNIHTAGEGSTLILSAETVAAHLCNETRRSEIAEDFDLYLTEGSQMLAFYWWTTANLNGSYIYIEFLPAQESGGEEEDTTYTVTLPTNTVGYSVRATSSSTVESGGTFSFKLNIYDDYKKGENFKVLANGVELTASGDTYTITNITENQIVTVEGVVEKTLAEKNVTVIVPAGSTVASGLFHSYFKYDFVDALEVTTLDDGRVQYIVPAAPGGDAFIRVQNPNGVTYWDFGDLNVGKIFNITDEMLFIGSTAYTKDTVFANYEKNAHDTASLYLTANAQGWLDMDTGDTHSLNVFRNWIPVSNSTTNTGVSLPDVTYTVVSPDGAPSDVVEVVPDANNSCYADIKAVKAGTAIILVTYDAVYNADGEGGRQFSAIWPENTGVIVVTVDAEDADIQTNITVNEEVNAGGKQVLDVEHDILFYVGDGAEYSFKPEAGCAVSVARSAVGSTMTFSGFTTNGVEVAADGTVTVTGLTTGAHILKVEKDGKTAYQVIRAREVSYKLTHSDGTEVTAENPAQPGETVTVQFSKLIDPMGKLSGVYNAKFGFRYVDEDGTVISIGSTSAYGEYYFGSNAARQRFTITVPTSWSKDSYTITDGSIMLGGWGGSFGDHRSTTYMEGKEPNLNASGTGGYASVMPDVVIPVHYNGSETAYTVTLPSGEGYTVSGSESPVQEGATYTFTVTVSDGYDGTDMVVKVNGEPVTGEDNSYTVEDVREDLVITVTGVEKITAPVESVTLNKTSLELEVGATKTLTATVSPNNATDKTVTWISSNEAVATVENGVVTAVAEGTAIITAKAGDKEATCAVTVTAAEAGGQVKVYLSLSHDADFMVGKESGTVVALREVNVPWFDLGLYGMEEYTYEEGKPTVLHLYIYATEVYYCGLAPEEAGQGYLYTKNLMYDLLQYNGSPGSIFFLKFWGQDANLNYYVNYQYPAKDGWGVTADQLVLQKNDIISVGHFTDWSFFGDSASGFNYLDIDGENLSVTVQKGEEITLRAYLSNGNLYGGSSAGLVREEKLDIYYAKADTLSDGVVTKWNKLGTTDSTGKLEIAVDLEPGNYVLAMPGQTGAENPQAIVSAPGSILLTVLESEAGDQVQDVINLIDAIGEVTLDSEAAITAARNAYDALTEEQQAAVTNYTELTDAEAKLAQLKQEKADRDAADAVTAKINAIGTVTLDRQAAIEEARTAYDALTDTQKALVGEDTLKKLTDAEAAYAELIADEADKAAAKAVEDKISAIGTVTLNSEQQILAARQAYEALTDTQKQLVGNYDVLTAAEKKLAELKNEAAADAVEEKIAAIGTVTLDSEDKIKAARTAYEALTDAQKALVENLSVLEAAEEALELLKLAGTDITDIYKTTGDYLAGLSDPGVGATDGEWRVIGLSRAGRAVPDSFYEAAVQYVQENIGENGRLHAAKSTDNSRLILALTAIGKDVTDVGGYDLLSGLNDMTYIGNQGINGTIWALIAFDSHDYGIPAGDVTREKLVQAILDAQLPGGGWALGGSVGDPDLTGMALQALAPYYKGDTAVKSAVDKALAWLSGIQSKDGTFTCSEGVTSESLAQVITGLTALGINPETDSRFIKNGVSAVDALSKFYVEGGGFKHGLTGSRNMMATEQGYYALVSYYRLLQGKTSLYDMSDVTIQTAARDQEAADAVEALIDAIGTVTKDSGDKIKAARDAYDALTDAQKKLVENYKTLTDAEAAYAELVKTAADEAAAKAVEDKIDAIGTVTLKSESKIREARAAYDQLTAVQKALVSNYDKLTAAEQKLLDLKDEAAANEVEKLIDAIGTVTKNSGDKIKAARAAYDALTDAQKKLVENYKTLTDAERRFKELNSTAEVTFTLLGCYKHDSDKTHTLAGGNLNTWIARKTYKVEPGATVKDVLEMALKEAGMSWKNPTGNYVEAINGIGEFTNGSNSGWMYTLNGVHPNLGVAEQTVKDGDVIVFHYTDDYTKEKGGTGFGEDTAIQEVEALIDAIGTVTLNSKDKIDAARKAYDNLTYAQKQKVENYQKLLDAEARYAELKKADDEKKAAAVEALIDQIDEEITLDSEEKIVAARKAYDALTADQKKLVDNYKKLTDAEYALALLKADEKDKKAAEAVEALIDAIGPVTLDSEDKIKAARDAYDKLTDIQKVLVKNYDLLEKAEAMLAALKNLTAIENAYITTGDYLENLGTPVPGSVGGEWMVIGLLRSGRQLKDADAYYEAVVKFVQENIDENGRLHNAKSTENARIILALTAMGKDVTNVGGCDLLTGLNDMEYVRKQGINGPIWALIALDSGNYPVPAGNVTREALIQVILDAQLADGGWALSGSVSDPDMTGMALQALAPYYAADPGVKKAVDEAVDDLSMMQAADGSFASIDGTSSESVAQVIAALSALGIDAETDSRFVKNGMSALDALYAFYVRGGGFRHIPDGKLDGMATEQSYYALAAYFRMLEGKTNLFDMTDVIDMGGDKAGEEPTETLPAETEPVATEPTVTEPTVQEGTNKGGFPWWLVVVIVVLAGAIVVLVIVSKPKKHKYVR